MKRGDRVRVVDAKEPGIPITEGAVYTVARAGTYRALTGEEPDIDNGGVKAVILQERPNDIFMVTRFEVIEE